MPEGAAVRTGGNQHAPFDRVAQAVFESDPVEPGHLCQHVVIDAPPGGRGDPDDLTGRLVELIEAHQQQPARSRGRARSADIRRVLPMPASPDSRTAAARGSLSSSPVSAASRSSSAARPMRALATGRSSGTSPIMTDDIDGPGSTQWLTASRWGALRRALARACQIRLELGELLAHRVDVFSVGGLLPEDDDVRKEAVSL